MAITRINGVAARGGLKHTRLAQGFRRMLLPDVPYCFFFFVVDGRSSLTTSHHKRVLRLVRFPPIILPRDVLYVVPTDPLLGRPTG